MERVVHVTEENHLLDRPCGVCNARVACVMARRHTITIKHRSKSSRRHKNSDLEMAVLLLGWFGITGTVTLLKCKHVQIGSDNTPTVSWTTKFTSKISKLGGRLARVFALCMQVRHTSPLVSHHITDEKYFDRRPTRLFGYKQAW